MKKIGWVLFGFLSIAIGTYPLIYGLVDMSEGFLGSKSAEIRESSIWNWLFYQHIGFGAISMLTGWTQFSKKLRARNINFHRMLGKIYVPAVILSGSAGLYLSFFATGGVVAGFGFGVMAALWLFTTVMAFIKVKNGEIEEHQNWMIRSYALCWAAVTLRIWLPLLQGVVGLEFMSAYLLVAWLCWVPNLAVAEVVVRRGH